MPLVETYYIVLKAVATVTDGHMHFVLLLQSQTRRQLTPVTNSVCLTLFARSAADNKIHSLNKS